jgi:predicted nucleotidyltransferase
MPIHHHNTELDPTIQAAQAPLGLVVNTVRAQWPLALAIYAFGSRVQGQAHAGSDLDLAVLLPAYADPVQCWNVAQDLADALGCEVDLLDLRAASTVMQYQVITTGQCLWAQQPAADLFACFVLREKLDLDAARAGLLADISESGKVYA